MVFGLRHRQHLQQLHLQRLQTAPMSLNLASTYPTPSVDRASTYQRRISSADPWLSRVDQELKTIAGDSQQLEAFQVDASLYSRSLLLSSTKERASFQLWKIAAAGENLLQLVAGESL